MNISRSIVRRVFNIFASFTLFLTLIYTGMIILVAFVIEDEVLEKVLAYEAQVIEKTFKEEGVVIQPRVDYMKLYLDPELAPEEIAKAYRDKTLDSEVFTTDNRHYHIQFLYFDKDHTAILVAEVTPFLIVSNAPRAVIIIFPLVFVAALFLALLLAYRIAKITTKPISTLAQEVMLQQGQVEPPSFSATESPDEIGYLANTIEHALTELKETLKREGDFNRDVSHELRTPLTVLNNTLALAQNRKLSTSDLEQLNDSTNQMNNIVTTLLVLARAESIEYQNLNLRALLEDCILSLHHKLVEKKLNINLNVATDYPLKANKQLVILLVNNLIENAIEYASGKDLLIRLENDKLLFENEISQKIALSSMEKLTEQKIKQADSPGFGQGLYLVKRILENLNWQFEIKSDGKSFQFAIELKTDNTK